MASLLILVGVSFSGLPSESSAQPDPSRSASAYMHVCGTQFCIGRSVFYPYGATFYQSTDMAGIDNPSGAVNLALKQHLNTIRLVNFLDLDGDPAVAPFQKATWDKVDTFIADAEAAHLKILLDLSDYRNELWNNCSNPYTANWTKYLDFVARRTNSVTHEKYASDPGIVLVTFAGEPLPAAATRSSTGSATNAPLTTARTN